MLSCQLRKAGEKRKVRPAAMSKAKTAAPIVLPSPQQEGLELLFSLLSKKYRMWREAPVFPWGQSNHRLWRKDITPISTARYDALYEIKILVFQNLMFWALSWAKLSLQEPPLSLDELFVCNPGGMVSISVRSFFLFQILPINTTFFSCHWCKMSCSMIQIKTKKRLVL